jgi:hypothetical protein
VFSLLLIHVNPVEVNLLCSIKRLHSLLLLHLFTIIIVKFFWSFIFFLKVLLCPSLIIFLPLDVVADDQEVLLVHVISIFSFSLFVI